MKIVQSALVVFGLLVSTGLGSKEVFSEENFSFDLGVNDVPLADLTCYIDCLAEQDPAAVVMFELWCDYTGTGPLDYNEENCRRAVEALEANADYCRRSCRSERLRRERELVNDLLKKNGHLELVK